MTSNASTFFLESEKAARQQVTTAANIKSEKCGTCTNLKESVT